MQQRGEETATEAGSTHVHACSTLQQGQRCASNATLHEQLRQASGCATPAVGSEHCFFRRIARMQAFDTHQGIAGHATAPAVEGSSIGSRAGSLRSASFESTSCKAQQQGFCQGAEQMLRVDLRSAADRDDQAIVYAGVDHRREAYGGAAMPEMVSESARQKQEWARGRITSCGPDPGDAPSKGCSSLPSAASRSCGSASRGVQDVIALTAVSAS